MPTPAPSAAVGRRTVASENRPGAERPALLAALRACIAGIEKRPLSLDPDLPPAPAWGLGEAGIDRHLPEAGLGPDAVHEIAAARYGDTPAAMGFAATLALRRLLMPGQKRRPLLWARSRRDNAEWGKLYGHGLVALGLPRDRLLTVTLDKPDALLWTIEEAVRSSALAAVIADTDARIMSLAVTRRLSLAAEAGATPLLLVFSHPVTGGTAALSRWQVKALASSRPPFDCDAPGPPAWGLTLERCRGGRPGQWMAEWDHATHRFSLVAALSGGKAESRPEAGGAFRPERSRPGVRAG